VADAEPAADRPLGGLIKHAAIYGSGFVATAAVGLILVPVYTHSLTPSDYGLLALMLVMYGLLKQVYDLGFTNSVARFFFDEDTTDVHHMSATGLAFLAGFGGALTALLWLLSAPLSDLITGSESHANLIRIVGVTLYAEALAIVPLTLIRMQERSTAFVAITLARLVAALVLGVVFVAVLDLGVRGALLGNAVPAVAVLVLLLPEYRHVVRGRPSPVLLRQMLVFGLPFFPVLLSGWLIDASDRYLLDLFRTREEVGLYSLAYRVAQVMQISVAAFSMGWAPLRYRIYSRPDAPAVYRQLTNWYVLAAAFVSVALSVFSALIIDLVAPPSYEEAAEVVPLLVFAYLLQGLYLLMVTGMGVTKRTAPMAWIGAAGAVLNVGINLLLIPKWGMKAAALTTVLAYALMVWGSWFYSQRVYPIPYDWARLARVFGIGTVVTGTVALISPDGIIPEIACAIIALALFSVLAMWLAVKPAELATARGWLSARLRRRGRPSAEPGIPG